ncbi:MAG TPA: head GIN domain-containing protein [Robiginitalea sp.]|nr:head GIN domain-containing protein [Robiginitalea sp.]
MKRTVLLAAASLLLACNLNAQWGKRIKGSGNEVTEERSVGSYSGIALSGWFDVELVAGTEGRITLKGEDNLLEHVETEVKNGMLLISTEKGYNLQPSWKGNGILVTVPAGSIDHVALSGSGDIVSKTRIKSQSFHTSLSGSGDISLEVEAGDMEVALSGSGDIALSGSAERVEIQVSGSGGVMAYELQARQVEALVAGSADIRVTATESLNARVSGSGDIHYRGNPAKLETKTSGSGDITQGE